VADVVGGKKEQQTGKKDKTRRQQYYYPTLTGFLREGERKRLAGELQGVGGEAT